MALTKCKECGEQISKKAEKCPKCGIPAKKKTSLFTWLVVIFLLLWIIGSISGGSNTTGTTNISISQPKVAIKQVVTQVNIRDILSAYKNNEVGADNKFKDKIIQTTGVIGSIKKDIMGSLYVTLGTGAQFEIPQIQAFFDDSQNNQLAQLDKGGQLTVVCRIEGLMMNVLTKDCVIK